MFRDPDSDTRPNFLLGFMPISKKISKYCSISLAEEFVQLIFLNIRLTQLQFIQIPSQLLADVNPVNIVL